MRKRANKGRMRERLIAAMVHHRLVDGLELAVLGHRHWVYSQTHKELKRAMCGAPARVLSKNICVADGAGGYIVVDRIL